MNKSLISATVLTVFLLASKAGANGVPLVASTYNFQLAGGGGGAQATLNGVPVEIYCDDFANDIWVPSSNSANVSLLTSGDLSETRFGGVSSWTTITSDGGTDDAFFNTGAGTAAAVRYDLVAYLVSLYNIGLGNDTSNNQIQEAIWTLMDPAAYASAAPPKTLINPAGVNPATDLEAAASWYLGGGATTAFLAQFEVVSDATMTAGNSTNGYVGVGGFQEQIVMTPTPEPRSASLILIGLFAVGGFLLHRSRRASAAVHAVS